MVGAYHALTPIVSKELKYNTNHLFFRNRIFIKTERAFLLLKMRCLIHRLKKNVYKINDKNFFVWRNYF